MWATSKTASTVIQWPHVRGEASVPCKFLDRFSLLQELICLFFHPHFYFLQIRALAVPEGQVCIGFFLCSYLKLDSACQLCSSSGSGTRGVKNLFYPSQFNSELEVHISPLRKLRGGKSGRTGGYRHCCETWSSGHAWLLDTWAHSSCLYSSRSAQDRTCRYSTVGGGRAHDAHHCPKVYRKLMAFRGGREISSVLPGSYLCSCGQPQFVLMKQL